MITLKEIIENELNTLSDKIYGSIQDVLNNTPDNKPMQSVVVSFNIDINSVAAPSSDNILSDNYEYDVITTDKIKEEIIIKADVPLLNKIKKH